jgi:site-specific DNA-methyltransferase (adenine-specific)
MRSQWPTSGVTFVEKTPLYAVAQNDALAFLGGIKDSVADIVFLDPPFNLRKPYGGAKLPEFDTPASYEQYLRLVIAESSRILAPGGALYLYHLPYWASRLSSLLLDLLTFRHWVAVSMKNGFARGDKLYPAHYALLYYTNGDPAHFNRPRLKAATCRSCGATIKDYGGYRSVIDKKGVNLSDIWEDLSPVRHQSRKHRAANELPIQLTDRIVEISGVAGGLLVDPFLGSGTSAVSAFHGGMRMLGNDLDSVTVSVAIDRLRNCAASSLPAGAA